MSDIFTNHHRYADLASWHREADELRAAGRVQWVDRSADGYRPFWAVLGGDAAALAGADGRPRPPEVPAADGRLVQAEQPGPPPGPPRRADRRGDVQAGGRRANPTG